MEFRFLVIAKLGSRVQVCADFEDEGDAEQLAASVVALDYATEAYVAQLSERIDLMHPLVRRVFPSLARAN